MNIPMGGLKQVATRSIGRGLLYTKKYSPEILTAVGVVGVVATAIVASRATLKLEPIIERFKKNVDVAKENKKFVDVEGYNYSQKDYVREMSMAVAYGSRDVVVLYAPALGIGLTSIACIVGAQGIMRKRSVVMAAAYTALDKSYNEFKKRFADEYGEEKAREYNFGIKEDVVKNEETGEDETIAILDPNGLSVYSKFFDEYSNQWSKDPASNMMLLRCEQNYANDLLHSRGFLFLNEVYKRLDIDQTSAGAVVGWVLGPDNDNFVDFGIFDASNTRFVNGAEASVLLDFNVDGVIFDKIDAFGRLKR